MDPDLMTDEEMAARGRVWIVECQHCGQPTRVDIEQPTVEQMLDALVERGHYSVEITARGSSYWDASAWGDSGVSVRVWSSRDYSQPASHAPDWRDALRSVYEQVTEGSE